MDFRKAVTFSYDDGIEQDRRLVEIFNYYGIKCTFNLNTGIQSPESNFDIGGVHISRMPQEGLADLYSGHEIASHGLTHSGLYDLNEEELAKEFLTDMDNIERIYGKRPVGMAYAYGDCDERIATYLKSIGIKYGRTTKATHGFQMPSNPILLEATCHHKDERLFELCEEFIQAKPTADEQMLFYVWGHSYEFDVDQNWELIESLCEKLRGANDIFYGTNAQCLGLM